MEQRNARLRWLTVWALAAVWMVAILARLTFLQLFQYSDYLAKAQRQQQRVFEVSPMRGTIYDRKGRELAVSLPMDSIFADPAEISDPSMVAQLLSRALDAPAEDLETKIRAAHTPVRLGKKLSPETVQRIDDMNLRGVFFEKENRRVYPQHELAAQILGYVDVDEKGIDGIEKSLDDVIRGVPGKMMVMADGKRRSYDRTGSKPDPGGSVTLTIDETIQYIAEKELAAGIDETHARHGAVVVQDPNTGELLAVANWPTFDPNDAGKYSDDDRNDRAVNIPYEPGSVFKVLTMTSAIENHVTSPTELIDCQMGSIQVGSRLIHDHQRFGVISVTDILVHSSDIGAIKIALRIGAPRFHEMVRDFGIGQLTDIPLPGERHGLLPADNPWSLSSLASISMGQEVSVTPIQIVSAISAVANGGTYYRPTIVHEIESDKSVPNLPGPDPRRVTDEETAATVRGMMESVVLRGTGMPARLDGYTAGGKSGTAQMIDPLTKRYSPTNYNASFIGLAPLNNPVVTILVVLDSPQGGHMGGDVAGPIFKRIAQQVLTYLAVPHDVPADSGPEQAQNAKKAQKEWARKNPQQEGDQDDRARFDAAVERQPARTVALSADAPVVVPNLAGKSVRDVIEACSRLGLQVSLIGDGVVLQQYPDAGAQIEPGSQVTVRFGKAAQLLKTSAHGAEN
ncbi:MAG TPA: penicillin-binding protein [Candidatus Acidoferrum sp.]|nr:penicillin-binding protein [Candidatus Acidoferrum sp.]